MVTIGLPLELTGVVGGPISSPGAEASSNHGNERQGGALSIFRHPQQICLAPGFLWDSQAWQFPHSTCQGGDMPMAYGDQLLWVLDPPQ